MNVTPLNNMCGAGLISGFRPMWRSTSRAVEDCFRATKNSSGHAVGNMFQPKEEAFSGDMYVWQSFESPPLLALHMLYCIMCYRLPSYLIYSSDECNQIDSLLKDFGFKYKDTFKSYKSGNDVRLYSEEQKPLHDALYAFCTSSYNSGIYSGLKGDHIEEAINYVVSGQPVAYDYSNFNDGDYDDYDD